MGHFLIYHINPGLKYLPKSGLMEFVFRIFQDNVLNSPHDLIDSEVEKRGGISNYTTLIAYN